MTDRPVNRCGVKGCVFIGRWAAGAMCPEHRNNPLTDKTHLLGQSRDTKLTEQDDVADSNFPLGEIREERVLRPLRWPPR